MTDLPRLLEAVEDFITAAEQYRCASSPVADKYVPVEAAMIQARVNLRALLPIGADVSARLQQLDTRWSALRAELQDWATKIATRPEMMVKTPFEAIRCVLLEMERLEHERRRPEAAELTLVTERALHKRELENCGAAWEYERALRMTAEDALDLQRAALAETRAALHQVTEKYDALNTPVCPACSGRGWIMRSESHDLRNGLRSGGSWNERCPTCSPVKDQAT